jgi:hypothetical protein
MLPSDEKVKSTRYTKLSVAALMTVVRVCYTENPKSIAHREPILGWIYLVARV